MLIINRKTEEYHRCFKEGDLVRHPMLGKGIVISVKKNAATVQFYGLSAPRKVSHSSELAYA